MSTFVRPHTYVAGTPIAAVDVRENHEAFRQWINAGMDHTDIADGSIDWTKIEAGEYASVTTDHRFTTGNHYSRFTDSDRSNQSAFGQSMKTVGATVNLWQPLTAKRFRVERSGARVMLSAYLQVAPIVNDVAVTVTGQADVAMLRIDGVNQAATLSDFYAADTGTSAAGADGTARRRVATMTYLMQNVLRGWHTVAVVANPMHDLSLILARSLQVEIFEV